MPPTTVTVVQVKPTSLVTSAGSMLSRWRRAEATAFQGGMTFWKQARPGVVSGGEVHSKKTAAARFSMHVEMNI
jgi:hypothetical protein